MHSLRRGAQAKRAEEKRTQKQGTLKAGRSIQSSWRLGRVARGLRQSEKVLRAGNQARQKLRTRPTEHAPI
jgi:hypothetical protein